MQAGERAERDRRRAARRLHPVDERAVARGRRVRLARQPRLADAGAGAHDDPVAGAVAARERDPLELRLAADERPGRPRCAC